MGDELTLSEILRRGVSVEWQEAVAVVRGVTEQLLGSSSKADVVPELHQIELSSDGRIDVVGAARVHEPVRRLGQLLQATLGNSDPPVQLRLVISQATAPTPAFGSIREYDEALSYFERPDRSAVLQALYARAAASPLSDVTSPPTLDAIAPLSKPGQRKTDRTRLSAASKRRAIRLTVSAALLLAVGVAGVQYARVSGIAPEPNDIAARARKISAEAGAALLAGFSKVTERAGLGRLVSGDGTAATAESPSAGSEKPGAGKGGSQTTPNRPNAQATSPVNPGQTPKISAFDLEPVPADAVAAAAAAAEAPVSSPESLSPIEPVAGERVAENPLAIYEPGADGVVPPVSIRPQLPRELPSDIHRDDLVSIELIVLPNGAVESVRLVGATRTMQDVMWLSAVKAWQFRPALKDGLPVKYRKIVWIVPQP